MEVYVPMFIIVLFGFYLSWVLLKLIAAVIISVRDRFLEMEE